MVRIPVTYQPIAFLVIVFALWITHVANAADPKVRMAIPSESMAQIAFYVRIEKGFYKQERLDVELILMRAPVANWVRRGHPGFYGSRVWYRAKCIGR
jgi:hypothetical protein